MIAVDTNILVYAHREDSLFHEAAATRIKGLAEGAASWAIPWPCVHEFLAIVTHPRIYAPATPLSRALDQVEAWLESPALALLTETADHWQALRAVLADGRITGPRIHDARVAALCRRHGVSELWSADRDFSRFSGLVVVNPLLSAAPAGRSRRDGAKAAIIRSRAGNPERSVSRRRRLLWRECSS